MTNSSPRKVRVRWQRLWRSLRSRLVLALAAFAALTSGNHNLNELERIAARGALVMLTVNGASTYYLGAEGDTGFEYDLARRFADFLDLPLEVVALDTMADLLPALHANRGDFIAANLSRTAEREPLARFGPGYKEVNPVVVYRRNGSKPATLDDLAGGSLAVIAGTSYVTLLEAAKTRNARLEWSAVEDANIEQIFDEIALGNLDYTIVDSNIFKLNHKFYPNIGDAFEIGQSQQLAWATRPGSDDGLAQSMREFFTLVAEDGTLAEIKATYYDHLDRFEPVNSLVFMERIEQRLPRFRTNFEAAAESYDLDWRLLAAVGYQESHWDPDAVSPTGVRGIMMLTNQTAQHLGIANRRDPEQSIDGGARYVRSMLDRMPERVGEPDRLWLALAAYNMGYGHLEDARRLTQAAGGDPDRWADVREHLPKLTQERYFRQTRYGYARGYQARHYVDNIRAYYEILVWMEGREHPLIAAATN